MKPEYPAIKEKCLAFYLLLVYLLLNEEKKRTSPQCANLLIFARRS